MVPAVVDPEVGGAPDFTSRPRSGSVSMHGLSVGTGTLALL